MKHIVVLRRALLAGAVLAALTVTTGCGNDHMSGTDHAGGTKATGSSASAAAGVNNADVMFAQMMIPHHWQAVEMADLAPTRANDPELKDLAARIKAAQDPEIVTMTGWLTDWGRPTVAPDGHGTHAMSPMPGGSSMGMAGMASQEQMDALRAASGTDFDRMFAELMIAHHNGAIEMAEAEQANGVNGEAKALAGKIAVDQAAEVRILREILDRL